MIRSCNIEEIQDIYLIINEAAKAYSGFIPSDCYYQPYMPIDELKRETKRMSFFGWESEGRLLGVMGLEPVKDVSLIRHAYVLPEWQNRGVGGKLLRHIVDQTTTSRLLVGTWAGAYWAIDFYKKYGFESLPNKAALLKTYWDISNRQIETSVVLGKFMGN